MTTKKCARPGEQPGTGGERDTIQLSGDSTTPRQAAEKLHAAAVDVLQSAVDALNLVRDSSRTRKALRRACELLSFALVELDDAKWWIEGDVKKVPGRRNGKAGVSC